MTQWFRARRRGRATCAEVIRVLQGYLDGHADELTARRVRRHLERCRRCGLEADTYQAIKVALTRRSHRVDPRALQRLRAFGERLADQGPAGTNAPMS